MKKNGWLEVIGAGTLLTGVIGLLVFLVPVFYVVAGFITGWIIELVFGGYVTDGLNLLLNTHRFHEGQLPTICATLGVVGSYFKSTQTNKKESK